MKLALERVQADVQNAARDTKWPTMNAKVAFIISGVKSVWAFNNLEFIADVKYQSATVVLLSSKPRRAKEMVKLFNTTVKKWRYFGREIVRDCNPFSRHFTVHTSSTRTHCFNRKTRHCSRSMVSHAATCIRGLLVAFHVTYRKHFI